MQSIFDNDFLDKVKAASVENKQLFVWHLLSYSGGASNEYIINSFANFYSILAMATNRSRFDIYKCPGDFFRGTATMQLLEQAIELFKVNPEITTYSVNPSEVIRVKAWTTNDLDDIKGWFEENDGLEIAVGRERPSEGRIIIGYFPDEDGIVRLGQY